MPYAPKGLITYLLADIPSYWATLLDHLSEGYPNLLDNIGQMVMYFILYGLRQKEERP